MRDCQACVHQESRHPKPKGNIHPKLATTAGDSSNARTYKVKTQRARRTPSAEGEPVLCVLRALVSCECCVRGWNFGVGFYAILASPRCEKAPWPGCLSGLWSSIRAQIIGVSPVIVAELRTRGPLWGIHPNSRLSTARGRFATPLDGARFARQGELPDVHSLPRN